MAQSTQHLLKSQSDLLAGPPQGVFECPGVFAQKIYERWGTRFILILAATCASMLIEYGILERVPPHSLIKCFFYSFSYSACIGLLMLYGLSTLSDRISRQPFPLNWFLLILTILVSTLMGCLLNVFLVTMIEQTQDAFFFKFIHSLKISLLLSLGFGTSFYLYENLKGKLEATAVELRTRQMEAERVRMMAVTAQLSSLESRVRPHFLFNTLNSISSLVRDDAERAERMIERLASLLRFSLDSNHHTTIPLRDEIKIVKDYLEIERERFGERLQFTIAVPAQVETILVPPFSLQTLVENSVKYCVSAQRGGGRICISAGLKQNLLRLEVEDNGCGFTPEKIIAGHGLDNLQTRLETLYHDDGTLEIGTRNGSTFVAIALPASWERLPV